MGWETKKTRNKKNRTIKEAMLTAITNKQLSLTDLTDFSKVLTDNNRQLGGA